MTFKLTFKNIGLFAFIWLTIGFALGFAVLMGPVRWVANYSRENNYSDSREALLIKGLIGVFIILSFIVSLLLSSGVIKSKSKYTKIVIPVVCLALAVFAVSKLLNPQNLKGLASARTNTDNKQFTFGSYPTIDELETLKNEGYTSVISLLHPAVTPFEPVLLEEEKVNCKKVGLSIISIPMLPWVSDNEEALNKIKQLAKSNEGKYYVHCYLGKDRVNVVKRIISTYNKSVEFVPEKSNARSLESVTSFERGAITQISKGVFFTPYPTHEEYTGYLVAGGVQQVISLMDTTDNEQKGRIDEERKLLSTYHIPFKIITIQSAKDKKELAILKQAIATMPKPLVIHRFFSNKPADLEILEAIKSK
jgi:protein tyrosine phosphatase (PTP) superfamily phosphohydrolase (DUF442 family)